MVNAQAWTNPEVAKRGPSLSQETLRAMGPSNISGCNGVLCYFYDEQGHIISSIHIITMDFRYLIYVIVNIWYYYVIHWPDLKSGHLGVSCNSHSQVEAWGDDQIYMEWTWLNHQHFNGRATGTNLLEVPTIHVHFFWGLYKAHVR